MKKLFTLSLMFLCISQAYSQATGNVVLFTEQGQKFWVILNGLRQNEEAATNVKLTDLAMPNYKMKLIFENQNIEEIDKNLMVKPGYEISYNIKKKEIKELNKKFKRGANNISDQVGLNKAYDSEQSERWVVRYISEMPLAQAPPPRSDQRVIVYNAAPPPTTTVTEYTTVTHATPGAGENVNINMNVGANGLSSGVSVNANTTGTHTSTHVTEHTTTTVTHGGHTNAAPVYVLPGYSGPTGCSMPMSDHDFASAKRSISSKSFDNAKVEIAKQIINSNCLLSSQVRDIVMELTHESNKLDFAKYAYGYTFDLGNYYKVNDAFTFDSTSGELSEYINGR